MLSNSPTKKRVFVSGCYDLLHSGHIAFFEEAAAHGDLYVGLGSDQTIYELKGRETINPENERLYMLKALKMVKEAWINTGSGLLDFEEDLRRIMPDILFVNEDGHTSDKMRLCEELGITYLVSKRIPHADLPARSTTALRQECSIPYRIDLAGGWLDQPYVSEFCPGPVITISIEPDYEFNDRSGMATSTRRKAIELWQHSLPVGEPTHYAEILFAYENPPGSTYVSGSQDALGIVLPGLNCLWYDQGKYWPSSITKNQDEKLLGWIENHLFLLALNPRKQSLNVTDNKIISSKGAGKLSEAAQKLWEAALEMDAVAFGKAMKDSFEAQISMFPNMMNKEIRNTIQSLPESVLGYKLSGAGGGGYLVLFSENKIEGTLKIRIRRPHS